MPEFDIVPGKHWVMTLVTKYGDKETKEVFVEGYLSWDPSRWGLYVLGETPLKHAAKSWKSLFSRYERHDFRWVSEVRGVNVDEHWHLGERK